MITITDVLLLILILLTLQIIHTSFKHFKTTTTIMATLQEIQGSTEALKTVASELTTQVTTLNEKLSSTISATDADSIKAEIDSITEGLKTLIPAQG
jgi:hypothetical protein